MLFLLPSTAFAVIIAVPVPTPSITPSEVTVATFGLDDSNDNSVLEALLEYFNNISGRVSNEYQRRIDAFQKQYNR